MSGTLGGTVGNMLTPQQLLMLLQQTGGALRAQPSTATPFSQGNVATPMSQYIGASGARGPTIMPQALPTQTQQPQGIGQAMQGGANNLMQSVALLQKMTQNQGPGTGLFGAPLSPAAAHAAGQTDAAANALAQQTDQQNAANANSVVPGMMDWLQGLFTPNPPLGSGLTSQGLY